MTTTSPADVSASVARLDADVDSLKVSIKNLAAAVERLPAMIADASADLRRDIADNRRQDRVPLWTIVTLLITMTVAMFGSMHSYVGIRVDPIEASIKAQQASHRDDLARVLEGLRRENDVRFAALRTEIDVHVRGLRARDYVAGAALPD